MARLTKEHKKTIDRMIKEGVPNVDIREEIGINPQYYIKKNYGSRKFTRTKHKHLRKEVMVYFQEHSFEETMNKFNLNKGQLKSLFTVCYRISEFKHLRKDKRQNHRRVWTPEEIIKMLNMCGIKSRQEIADKLDRGNARVVKEKLMKLGISTRNVNGMNLQLFKSFFGCNPLRYTDTTAGPPLRNCFKIVLWYDIDNWIKEGLLECPKIMRDIIEIYAMFQLWRFSAESRKLYQKG